MKELGAIIISIATVITPAFFGVLGSVGFYLHEISQDPESFNKFTLFIYIFLGIAIGIMMHNMMLDFLGQSYAGVIIAAGFSVRKITDIAESYLRLGIKLPKK